MQFGLPFGASASTDLPPPAPLEATPTAASALGTLAFYFVRHRRARRYLLRVDPDGRVRVTIPSRGSRRQAEAFASRHLEWIHAQRARLVSAAAAMSVEERRVWIGRARAELPPRVHELAARLELSPARISIRNQRSRWGSCAKDGHISLNWRLIRMPDWVRDYVIVHELMHLRRMDHSPEYWRLVAAAFPDYAAARAWLRANGRTL